MHMNTIKLIQFFCFDRYEMHSIFVAQGATFIITVQAVVCCNQQQYVTSDKNAHSLTEEHNLLCVLIFIHLLHSTVRTHSPPARQMCCQGNLSC